MKPRVLLALLLACAAPARAEPQESIMVHVQKSDDGYAFLPARIEIAPGGTVQLMVFGSAKHGMTSADDAWPDAVADARGSVGTAEFAAPLAPGEYAFRCPFHEGLEGTLVVVGAASAEPPRETPGATLPFFLAALVVLALSRGRRA